jgi:DNA-binding HxlR family transcriptional regulator
VLDRISDKWVTLVIASLSDGPQRFSELSRQLAGVSQKMLTQTLRTSSATGLVTRTVTAAVPVRVDYALTDLGHSLLDPIKHLKAWAEDHVPEVREAQEAYDQGAGGARMTEVLTPREVPLGGLRAMTVRRTPAAARSYVRGGLVLRRPLRARRGRRHRRDGRAAAPAHRPADGELAVRRRDRAP